MKEEMGGGILVVNQVAKHCMMCKTYNLYIELQALAFHLTSSSKYCCKNYMLWYHCCVERSIQGGPATLQWKDTLAIPPTKWG